MPQFSLYQLNSFGQRARTVLARMNGRYQFLIGLTEAYHNGYGISQLRNFSTKPLKWVQKVVYTDTSSLSDLTC